ncbi:MAG: class I SAM-dependent methyltransferase [Acidimicrobiales bacterium]
MVTLPTGGLARVPHEARHLAESFGSDPERYDRTRPSYPKALVERIVAAMPGSRVLDVGIGSGIAAESFEAAGCAVLGVDPDEALAAYARRRGFQVEVARFEDWEPAGRTFDAVVAGQAWHWVDPVAGAAKAAEVLEEGGHLAVFWNAMQFPPEVAEAFAGAVRRAVPGVPVPSYAPGDLSGYSAFFAAATDGMRRARAFSDPEQWQVDWEQVYSRAQWLDLMPTAGGFNRLDPSALRPILDQVGAAIDAIGGSFTMRYATVAVTARRTNRG